MSNAETTKYPLLTEILSMRQLPLQPMYSIRDVATLFSVSVRAIQNRVVSGQLAARDLPGRMKFLSADLEAFLSSSKKKEVPRPRWPR